MNREALTWWWSVMLFVSWFAGVFCGQVRDWSIDRQAYLGLLAWLVFPLMVIGYLYISFPWSIWAPFVMGFAAAALAGLLLLSISEHDARMLCFHPPSQWFVTPKRPPLPSPTGHQ